MQGRHVLALLMRLVLRVRLGPLVWLVRSVRLMLLSLVRLPRLPRLV
jgi:hypothetical protein